MLALQAVSPTEVDRRGGTVLSLRGHWPSASPLRVSLQAPDGTLQACYSGEAGQATDCYAFGTALSCVSPAWPEAAGFSGPVDVLVLDVASGLITVMREALLLSSPSYDSLTYALRNLYPPGLATGPRALADEATYTPLPGALLSPLLQAFGGTLSGFGGIRLSSLAEDTPKGSTSLLLTGATGWPQAGQVVVGSVLYYYSARTGARLLGLSYRRAGIVTGGLAGAQAAGTQATDASRAYSQLDALRNAYFLSRASGSDLATCGRNYGLGRDPAVSDDATFAKVLEVMAYGPRGTMLALRTALDALLGAGAYALEEDTLKYPCKVFIRPLGPVLRTGSSLGRSYLSGPGARTASGGTFTLPSPVYGCNRICLPGSELQTSLANRRPPAPWGFQGSAEPSVCAPRDDAPGLARCTFLGASGIYWGPNGIDPGAQVELACTLRPEAGTPDGMSGFVLAALTDGAAVACTIQQTSGALLLRPCDATGNPQGSSSLPVPSGRMIRLGLRRRGLRAAEVFVEGNRLPLPLSSLPSSSGQGVFFGMPLGAPSPAPRLGVSSVDLSMKPARNYVEAVGRDAHAAAGDDSTVQVEGSDLTPAMVGKEFVLRRSSAARSAPGADANGPRGSNAGTYRVEAVSGGDQAQVSLWSRTDAFVSGNRLTLPENALRYPDDLGRRLDIGGDGSNAGAYYVAGLLGSTGTEHRLPYPRACAAARLVNADGSDAALLTQGRASVTLQPSLVAETGLRWSVPDALKRTESGGSVTLAPAQPLPDPTGAYDVTFDDVRGGVVVESTLPEAFLLDEGPPLEYATYPLYVTDALSYAEAYTAQLTAAGVRPVFAPH